MKKVVCDLTAAVPTLSLSALVILSVFLLSLVVVSRDRQERWEGGVMTCDKGCMPDWRVHSMRLSHLSRHDTIKPHGLQRLLRLQEELFR